MVHGGSADMALLRDGLVDELAIHLIPSSSAKAGGSSTT